FLCAALSPRPPPAPPPGASPPPRATPPPPAPPPPRRRPGAPPPPAPARARRPAPRPPPRPAPAPPPAAAPRPPPGRPPLRLGLRLVRGLQQAAALRLVRAREQRPFAGLEDLARRAGLDRGQLAALAAAHALRAFSAHRHRAHWDVAGLEQPTPLCAGAAA